MSIVMIKWLRSFDDVVAVAGGQKVVAGICRVSVSTISEWRTKRGQFDAACEDAINDVLLKYDCMAHGHLFVRVGSPTRPVGGKLPRWTEELRQAVLKKK
jgi:hypothetical protein